MSTRVLFLLDLFEHCDRSNIHWVPVMFSSSISTKLSSIEPQVQSQAAFRSDSQGKSLSNQKLQAKLWALEDFRKEKTLMCGAKLSRFCIRHRCNESTLACKNAA